jgi:hypothetical protein
MNRHISDRTHVSLNQCVEEFLELVKSVFLRVESLLGVFENCLNSEFVCSIESIISEISIGFENQLNQVEQNSEDFDVLLGSDFLKLTLRIEFQEFYDFNIFQNFLDGVRVFTL